MSHGKLCWILSLFVKLVKVGCIFQSQSTLCCQLFQGRYRRQPFWQVHSFSYPRSVVRSLHKSKCVLQTKHVLRRLGRPEHLVQYLCIEFQSTYTSSDRYRCCWLSNPSFVLIIVTHFSFPIAIPVSFFILRLIHLFMNIHVIKMIVQSQTHQLLHDHPCIDRRGDQIPANFQQATHGMEESSCALPRLHHVMNGELNTDHVELVRFGNAPALLIDKHGIHLLFFTCFSI
mmetsp:Transcript_15149/g.24635  ORF Transcript_15149/g.24635 Transcript_15149/m.24635 type:complete len:230 (+) Transcript_15149:282-971(+)